MIESERDVGSNRVGGLFFGHGIRNIDNAGDDYLSLKSSLDLVKTRVRSFRCLYSTLGNSWFDDPNLLNMIRYIRLFSTPCRRPKRKRKNMKIKNIHSISYKKSQKPSIKHTRPNHKTEPLDSFHP